MANIIKIDNALLKRQKQKEKKRSQRKKTSCRILVVCEGTKTEPLYFKAFKTINNESFTYEVNAEGKGFNTVSLVKEAIRLKELAEKAGKPYDSVWAVFDKDSFSERVFNDAIKLAERNDINAAWSNEAFELWYLYHFHNRVTAMSRDEYKKAISDAVNKSSGYKNKRKYEYKKNDKENYLIMTKYGSQEDALRWAEAGHNQYKGSQYAKYNPCTTVYKLVLQLLNRDKNLIAQVMEKIK